MIRFYHEGQEVDLVNLGTTELGTTNRLELVMKNDFYDKVELLEPIVEDSSLKIIEFSPNINRTESLKDSKIKFRVVIG